MKYARIENSKRLQRFLGALSDGQWHSTREIIQTADVCAVNSCAAECNAQGQHIQCDRRGDVWYYRLAPRGQLELMVAA